MGWIKQITRISKTKKILLLILAVLMVVNDLGRLVSMLTDAILLGGFVVILASGLADEQRKS